MMRHYKGITILTVLCALVLLGCKTTKKPGEEANVQSTKENKHKTTPGRTIEELQNLRDEDKSIVFLFETDVHCNIDGYTPVAGLRDAIRDTALCGLVSCGDYMQGGATGAMSRGQYIADVMRAMDYTVVTLGNHEFDFKMPRLLELVKQMDAPVTCVNLINKDTKERLFSQYVMVNIGNKKIAFIGVVTPTALYTEESAFYDENGKQTYELCEENLYEEVQLAVNNARKCDADYVVVLSHLGQDDNQCHINSHDLIRATYGIDVLLDGHTHTVVPESRIMNKKGFPVLIAQAGLHMENVGKLLITQEGQISIDMIPTKKILYRNPKVAHATDSIKALCDKLLQREVCKSDVDFAIEDVKGNRMVRNQECTAGNLVTDAFRNTTNADIAILNGGSIRKHIKAGTIKYGDILDMLPYENYLCTIEITGQKLQEVLEACVALLPAESGDFPQVSGIKFTIDTKSKPRVKDLKVLNRNTDRYEAIDTQKNYTVATMDYCVTGGGLASKLKDAKILKHNLMPYNEALIEYITKFLNKYVGIEYEKPEGRIQILK